MCTTTHDEAHMSSHMNTNMEEEEPIPQEEAKEREDNLIEDRRNTITQKELSECDREDLSHIGLIQGGCGHVVFIKHPSGVIIGHDQDIRQVEFFTPPPREPSKISLIGTRLIDCIPAPLHGTILDCISQMRMAMSHRTFYFYAMSQRTFALSISSPEPDYSVIGIEIESSPDSQEVSRTPLCH